jgi:hypothetical protein
VVTALVAWLIRRDIATSLADAAADQGAPPTIDPPSPSIADRRANRATIGLFAALLLVGAVTWNAAVNGTMAFERDGLRGAYPAYYTDATQEGELLRVADTLGSGAEFAVVRAEGDTQAIAERLAAERGAEHTAYRVMRRGPVTLNGRPALMERFAYVEARGLIGAAPHVIEGIDYIFAQEGRAVVITMLAAPEQIDETDPLFRRFLSSLSFS